MKKLLPLFATIALAGCATQTPQIQITDAPASRETQAEAQEQMLKNESKEQLQLKRKIAVGRISNETNYGRSLLRDDFNDPLGKQVGDMLSARLIESGSFMVFERPDLARVEQEREMFGASGDLVGVDTLIVGSLTEFGRNVTGEKGFLSSSKKQSAYAKVELRLINVETGQAFFSSTGTGEASLESASVAGFGSRASYDGTLTDKAISSAISDVLDEMIRKIMEKPWTTSILDVSDGQIFISGGESQGLKPGKVLVVKTQGKQVKSKQTGFTITLPGTELAKVKVIANFGDSESNEGSIVELVEGSIDNYQIDSLSITE
ncbi:MAG: CsgG/HfaB family protein [Endozoicomonas sp.]|uniref:CsgG/HfaB family protein n=1 Tax=Endozoicomonas sp. TaxID=1892382 RepID=UPI003D9B9517